MITDILIVSIAGGILCLDRVFVQTMVSRPIVTAPLIGFSLGDPYTGLIAGAFIELFWIDRLPIGAYIPPNDTLVAVLIAAGAIESGSVIGGVTPGLLAMSVLIFVPMGLLAKKMERRLILFNEGLAREALNDALRGDIRSIDRNHLRAALMAWILPTGLILITLPLGIGLMSWLYPRFPAPVIRGLQLLYSLIPLIGAAVALNGMSLRGMVPIFCVVFLAVTVILNLMRYV
jgi:PTS system mannose-specific IIC component